MKGFVAVVFFIQVCLSYAQTQDSLPFHIDPSKKIPDFELEDKKEGTYQLESVHSNSYGLWTK